MIGLGFAGAYGMIGTISAGYHGWPENRDKSDTKGGSYGCVEVNVGVVPVKNYK